MNYYEILNLSQKATEHEIKRSYKKLVKKYHPDLYVGDKEFAEKKIKEINEAYDILSNPQTKQEYDNFLHPTVPKNPTVSSYESTIQYNTKFNNAHTNKAEKWNLTKFIFDKFSKLETKHQLQLFILILIIILSLYLMNLIETKQYLSNKNVNTLTPSTSTKNDTSDFNNLPPNNTNIYTENDFETFDNLLYDLFEPYQENSLYENQF